jgi:phosphatidate cytidylyltransferase
LSDREHDEFEEGEPKRPGATEGVRILGAEEAQAALEGGQVARRLGDDAPRFGDVPPRPDPSVRPAARFPSPAGATEAPEAGEAAEPEHAEPPEPVSAVVEDPATEIEADRAFRDELSAIVAETDAALGPDGPDVDEQHPDLLIDVSDEVSGPVPLPHWTEPPTGEIPVILPESDVIDDPSAEHDLDTLAASSPSAPRFRSGVGDWSDSDFDDPGMLKDEEVALGALADAGDDDAEFEESVAQRRRRRLRVRPAADGDRTDGGAEPAPGVARARAPQADAEPVVVPAPGSDLTTRVVVGVAIGVAALICLEFGRGSTAVLATVIVGIGTFEFYEAIRRRGFHPATILGLLAAVTTPLAAYKVGEGAFPLILALLVVFSMLWYMFGVVPARPLVAVAVTVLGYVYVGVLGGFAGLMLAYPNGVGLILGVAICAVAYDVVGYLVGSQFGKTRLAPHLSPNKTLEGLLGGMAASIIVSAAIVNNISPWSDLGHALSLGVLVAIMAPLGDLCESMLKRDLAIKDFGALLPGHGGILDRFDAILFCLPAVYYLARYLEIG